MTRPSQRRHARRLLLFAAAATLGAVLAAVATAPPRAVTPRGEATLTPALAWPNARGVIHLHTSRSDGSGSLDEVAAAGARARLDFLIVTDHGDATRPPEPPAYRHGVLVIDAVEISTDGGHLAALDLPQAPYPLAGDARGVVEDVHRLGGFAIATHPDSAKRALRWDDWTLPIDGFEWLNGDSQWRDETRRRLALAVLHYPLRPAETIASMFDRPEALLARWDAAGAAGRRLVAVAGADAHARLGVRGSPDDGEEGSGAGTSAFSLHLPSYEAVFRAFSTRAVLRAPLSGDAASDARAVLAAVRAGQVYTVIDGLAGGGAVEFLAESAAGVTPMGGRVACEAGCRLSVRAAAPAGATLVLLENGRPVARSSGLALDLPVAPRPGDRPRAYRAEVRLPGGQSPVPVPWIATNSIFVASPTIAVTPPAGAVAAPSATSPPPLRAGEWRVEHDPASRGAIAWGDAGAGGLRFDYRLAGGGTPTWTALVRRWPPADAGASRIVIAARASPPLRVSVQVREADASRDRRWRQSVHLDEVWREVVLQMDAFRPVTRSLGPVPPGRLDSLLVVVDRVHAAAGSAGAIWVRDIRVER